MTISHGLTPTEHAITMLMSRGKLPWNMRIEPEQRDCIEFADIMRRKVVAGEYKGIFGHIPNEGKRHPLVALLLRAMGMIPGIADYFFIWDGGAGVIEFKHGKNKLTPNQDYFRLWCEASSIPHAVCFFADQGIDTLQSWGAFFCVAHKEPISATLLPESRA